MLFGVFAEQMTKGESETSQKESETVERVEIMQEESETNTGKYADTSSYEELDELYKEYFMLGTGCEAIDHWNNQLAEIGNPEKEALISRMYNSMNSNRLTILMPHRKRCLPLILRRRNYWIGPKKME